MKRILLVALPVVLTACSTQRSVAPASAPGMVRGPQNADSSFAGPPGGNQDSSFAGKPDQGGSSALPPQGVGFNQAPGELRPQMGGGDVHYHTHYHGTATPPAGGQFPNAPAGYAAPVYGAPVRTGQMGQFNNGTMQAPLGTGGGGAGWYGPEGNGGPGGIRQGFGVGGWGTPGGYGNPANNGWWNGYTD